MWKIKDIKKIMIMECQHILLYFADKSWVEERTKRDEQHTYYQIIFQYEISLYQLKYNIDKHDSSKVRYQIRRINSLIDVNEHQIQQLLQIKDYIVSVNFNNIEYSYVRKDRFIRIAIYKSISEYEMLEYRLHRPNDYDLLFFNDIRNEIASRMILIQLADRVNKDIYDE